MSCKTDNDSDIVIDVRQAGKRYRLFERPHQRLLQMLFRNRQTYFNEVAVLRDVSFQVRRGETVGIVGRNGAGKSTLLQMIAGTLQPSEGSVITRGRIAPLIELGSGFNPELTGRENVLFSGMVLGMSEQEVKAKFDRIAAFADIGEYMDRPVKTYSSGMFARLAFAVAIHVDPDILIVDEILSVGDAAFQRKCMARFYEIRERGCTILIVAHDEYLVRSICQRCLYLKEGRMIAFGEAGEVVGHYMADLTPPEDLPETPPLVAAPIDDAPAAESVDEAAVAEMAVVVEAAPAAASPLPSESAGPIYRITGVRLLDAAGQPVATVPHGSTVTLEFGFEALARTLPAAISFVFNLYAVNGTYVCGTTTLMDREGTHRAARNGQVKITFPNMPLLAGKYFWRVAINDEAGLLVLAEAKHVCPFRVLDDYRSAGTVHLQRIWQFNLS